MSVRHISCLSWNERATPEAVEAIRAALEELPDLIPELRAYTVGADLGLAAGNADFAIVADFDDVEAWRRYTDHPAHQAVLVEQIRPILASRVAVQLVVPGSPPGGLA
jgi:Stress responsive A/B Barrel Domain